MKSNVNSPRYEYVWTLLVAVAGLLLPPFAISAQQMSWQDLGFTVQSSEDPFFGLGLEQKQSLETVLVRRHATVGIELVGIARLLPMGAVNRPIQIRF